ncbi:TetR family transcriptional regulator [Mycolicibacterium madagascariense]|uniref:TetR family transcriptional regulator n=1 Tax=Mycolicibacterium madagascariense TaxID=212765 RepID=A0A7I7X8D6_9MYCO|nr:TetR/AcrR family transcriptional regulator [Mycolicibacterium madagascariense]MCV7014195.1 TetR/AcrR family transcriptional regulator [Mycolicibacterium madagascariense]BBZ25804.1 TetR family transcriptional regulator [Mycolicibacterium madagascariense]
MARPDPQQRRAARHARPGGASAPPRPRKDPITVERIIDAALQIVATQGHDALTMRSVAQALGTGPASLYVHVVNKSDIDELLIGRLCSELVLPQPQPTQWREQLFDVCVQIRDQYLRYPGIASAALATASTNLDTLRVAEGMLAITLAGGVPPQRAAWAIDALSLYVAAYTLELSLVHQRRHDDDENWVVDREELIRRLTALPADEFPHTRRHAAELTGGSGHDRFDFTMHLFIDNLN